MHRNSRTRLQLRLMNLSFVVLFLAVVGLLQWLSREYHLRIDLTQTGRHSLSPASQAVVERMNGLLTVTAYASNRGETRELIRDLVGRYQKYKRDIKMEFVDPDRNPGRAREAGVKYDGELILQHQDAKEDLAPNALNEEGFTNALTRLAQRGERWIVFLSGHGERSPDRQANFDLSIWASQLRKRGFKARTLSLADHPQIPQNTTILVIAGPRTKLLAGEVEDIGNFVKGGGNLLWLSDPAPLYGLEPLAEQLGIEFVPGVVVDPESAAITRNASAIVVAKYGSHPVVKNFTEVTLFPDASALTYKAPEGWRASSLIETRAGAWSETGERQGRVEFDKGRDIAGPLTLGVALTHDLDQTSTGDQKRQQRVIVLGDGDFLSNSFLGNGANLDLGMSIVNWLSQNDAYVSIPVRMTPDRSLNLSRTAQAIIAGVFILVIPLLLAGGGVTVWMRRRKR